MLIFHPRQNETERDKENINQVLNVVMNFAVILDVTKYWYEGFSKLELTNAFMAIKLPD